MKHKVPATDRRANILFTYIPRSTVVDASGRISVSGFIGDIIDFIFYFFNGDSCVNKFIFYGARVFSNIQKYRET